MHFDKEIKTADNTFVFVSFDNFLSFPCGVSALPIVSFFVCSVVSATLVSALIGAEYLPFVFDLAGPAVNSFAASVAFYFYLMATASASSKALPYLVALVLSACFSDIYHSGDDIKSFAAYAANLRSLSAAVVAVVFALVLMPVDKLGLNLAWVPTYFYGLTAPAGA